MLVNSCTTNLRNAIKCLAMFSISEDDFFLSLRVQSGEDSLYIYMNGVFNNLE